MDVVGLAARRTSSEDDVIFDLSLGYDRGAVLVYHFYDQIKAFEPVGVNIKDYFASLLKNIDFEREANRLTSSRTRLERVKNFGPRRLERQPQLRRLPTRMRNWSLKLLHADKLMKHGAMRVHDCCLRQPCAKIPITLGSFGLAEVASNKATSLDDADRVEEALFAAIEYYRQAAKKAAPEREVAGAAKLRCSREDSSRLYRREQSIAC
jgi:hypothetical protein